MSSINLGDKGIYIDKLAVDHENFENSSLILANKGSLEAIKRMYGLENDLLKFAHDPNAKDPLLPPMPQEPNVEGMSPEEAQKAQENYERLKHWWDVVNSAHQLKVPIGSYMHIIKYMDKWKRTLHATPAVKGRRFFAFTKTVADEKKGGLLSLFGEKD